MRLRSSYWVPGLIFLVSFFFHLSLISKGPVTVDCLNLVVNSQATLETHHLHYQYGSGYPLMVLLGSIFIAIGKYTGITDPVLAVNFISVVFGSIAIPVFYLLVLEICDAATALLASFILLINPIFVDVSTYGINHAPALCFFLLGLLSLLRFQTAGRLSYLLLSALYFGLMGASRLPDIILTFPAIGFMFIFGLNKHRARYFLLFITAIALIIILFHLPYYLSDHANYDIQAKNNWKLNLTGSFQGPLAMPFIKSLSYLIRAFNIGGILCFAAGLYYTYVFSKKLLIFITLWWVVPLVLLGNIVTSAPRYFTILLPAFIIPISILLAGALRHKKMLWRLIASASCLIIFIQPLWSTQKNFIRRHQYDLISDYYRWVGKSTPANAVIISSDDKLFITYYSRRGVLEKPLHAGHLSPLELIDFKRRVDRVLDDQRPVYITVFGAIVNDYYFEFRDFLKKNYRLIKVGQRPLEIWYETPYETHLDEYDLIQLLP